MFYKFGIDKELLRAGKVFGLLAGGLLICQPVFISRFKFLDRGFGQDRLLVFHRYMAVVLTCFATLHPFFILWAEGFSFFPMELRFWPAFLGMGLLFLLFSTTFVCFLRSRIGLQWNGWLAVHKFLSPVIMAVFIVHVLNVSKPFETGLLHWLVLGTVVCLVLLFFRRWVLNYTAVFKKKYQVTDVRSVAQNSWAVHLRPLSKNRLQFTPGQFAYLTFLGKQIPKEEHPFTIASGPDGSGELEFIIRSSGDFTRQIPQLEPGETVLIDGPYGLFGPESFSGKTDMIMIAGGIGITPMLSMLRALKASEDPPRILLIWSNKTADDIVLKDEFSALQENNTCLDIHHILTRSEETSTRFNRIDSACLTSLFADIDPQAPVLLCGPPAMQSGIQMLLKSPEFSSHTVYTESFVL